MKRKFRKLSAFPHRIEDDLNKLDYLLGNRKNFSVRSSCSSGKRTKMRMTAEHFQLKNAVKITEANDANQTSKKSLEKGTQKSKKKLVGAEKTEKSKKTLKKRTKKSIVPRTCRDSPVNLPKKPLTRMASLDLGKAGKVAKKTLKKKPSLQTLKKNSKGFGKDEQVENLMSPIKKVKQNFLNPDETSLLSVLDILASN